MKVFSSQHRAMQKRRGACSAHRRFLSPDAVQWAGDAGAGAVLAILMFLAITGLPRLQHDAAHTCKPMVETVR